MLRKKLWSNLYQCLIMCFEANHYFPSQIIRESFIFNASQGCSTNIIIEVHGSSFSISMLCLLCWLNDPLKVCSGRCVYISCFSRQQLISTQRQKGEAGGNLENQSSCWVVRSVRLNWHTPHSQWICCSLATATVCMVWTLQSKSSSDSLQLMLQSVPSSVFNIYWYNDLFPFTFWHLSCIYNIKNISLL